MSNLGDLKYMGGSPICLQVEESFIRTQASTQGMVLEDRQVFAEHGPHQEWNRSMLPERGVKQERF
jgi:hypothetical protein